MLKALDLDRSDLKLLALTFGLALLAAAVIYAYAFALPPDPYAFSGFLLNSPDGWSYRAAARAFAGDGWLIGNPYDAARRPPDYLNPVWLAVGKAMALTGLDFLPLYYLAGIVSGALMYIFLLALMKAMFRDRAMAWCAYLLAGFGSGFGWMVSLVSEDFFDGLMRSNDFLHPEAFPFAAFLSFPHVAFAYFLFLAAVLGMYRSATGGGRGWLAAACLAVLVLGFSRPHLLVTLALVAAAWHLVMRFKHGRAWRPRWKGATLLCLGMVPGAVYGLTLFRISPELALWGPTDVLRTVGWKAVVVGFAPMLFTAMLAFRGILPLHSLSDRYLLAAVWFLVNFCLVFSYPLLPFEARMNEGLVFPLAILGAWGFFGSVLPAFRRGGGGPGTDADMLEDAGGGTGAPGVDGRLKWAVGLALLAMPTHFFWIGEQFRMEKALGGYTVPNGIAQENEAMGRLTKTANTDMVLHRSVRQAIDFLAGNVPGEPVVLAASNIGLVLPALAPVKPFAGHQGLTPDIERKLKVYAQFYYWEKTSVAERRDILLREGIDLIWFGPEEYTNYRFDPVSAPYLVKIFQNDLIRIYRVDRRRLG